jgi:hypothetical protein
MVGNGWMDERINIEETARDSKRLEPMQIDSKMNLC